MADPTHTRRAWDETLTPTPSSSDSDCNNLPNFGEIAPTRISAFTVNPTDLVGKQIDNYRVEALIAQGGFGMVYKAADVKLGRTVALKFLKDRLDEKHLQLFEREARALAQLSKERLIVAVYAWGEFNGLSYFAMEYLPLSADTLLKRHPGGLGMKRALEIAADCAEGLAAAHKENVIHRDVKPPNIMLDSEDGRAKLADFGLSRIQESGESILAGTVSGSPPYMSPEQAAAENVDHRSDIFSMGVTLYELLSGKRPFEGNSSGEFLYKIRHNMRVPLSERNPDLPKAVQEIVERATAHDPAHRYQNAADFAEDLRDTLHALDEGSEPTLKQRAPIEPPRKPRVLSTMGTAAVAVLVVAAAALYPILTRPTPALSVELDTANQQLESGDLSSAERLYEQIVNQEPDNAHAWYGLGYTRLKQRKFDEAAAAFDSSRDEPLKTEGLAAVNYSQNGPEARQEIERALNTSATAYLQALRCAIDAAAEEYDKVIEVSRQLQDAQFQFAWQRAEFLTTLGQAYYRTGDLANAQSVFDELRALSPSNQAVPGAYLELIRGQLDDQRREAALNRAKEIHNLIVSGKVPAPVNKWTSRPLTFATLPVVAGRNGDSQYARQSGLLDCMPILAGQELEAISSMAMVDREMLGQILQEQQLSALLGTDTNQIQLGRVLGARFLIRFEFGRLGGSEFVNPRVVDTETTRPVPVSRVDIVPGADPRTLIAEVVRNVVEAVEAKYPLQARLVADAGRARIDLGANVGLNDSTRFEIRSLEDAISTLSGRAAIVTAEIGDESAYVELEGMTPADIPENGLYLVEKPAPAATEQPQ